MSTTLGELFKDLSFGPLSNLTIGGQGSGVIPVAQENRILSLTNTGLTKLYTKFVIAEKELVVRTIADKELYPLRQIHADNDPGIDFKFIADTPEDPFLGDMVRILLVGDADGNELPLNDYNQDASVFTPKPDVLQILNAEADTIFHVIYQANHAKLLTSEPTQDIDLPEPLQEALVAYVGYRILEPMNGEEHSRRANELKVKYESICSDALDRDLGKYSITTSSTKLEDRGFV